MTKTQAAPLRRFALIGCGRIGSAVLAAWQGGALPGWELVSVLSRTAAPQAGALATTDAAALLALEPDLIVECAGPAALAQHGEAALAVAPVWTVSGVALADAAVWGRVNEAARRSGHRLRVLPGALAGLDGVAAAAVDPLATLQLDIDLLPGPGERA